MNIKTLASFSIGPIIGGLLSIITLPIIAWLFTVEDVGKFAIIQVTISLGVVVFSLAMHQAYLRKYNKVGDRTSLLKMAIMPGFLVFYVVSPFSVSSLMISVDSPLINFLVLLSVISLFFLNFIMYVLRMEGRGWLYSLTQILSKNILAGKR